MAAEGNIVGEVGLLVKPVDPGFNAGVKKIIDKIERDAQFKVGADTQQAQSALNGLDTQIGSINNGLIQSAVNVAGITAAMYALKGAANQVIGKFAGLFDQLAQAKAGFSSILKSEKAGNNLLADIQEFARVSPFVTQELVNYSQQLLGVGLSAEKITPLLKNVGNIISSVGGDTQNMGRVLFTLTQIQSIGRLAGQDAMQLQSALIPITKYLSSFLGKTTAEVKKLQEQGKISSDTVFAAIAAQGAKVEGAMDKATRNIAGARAILGDTITLMLQRSPELQRIFDDIFHSIITFSNFMSRDDVSIAIADFLKSVGSIYDGLKPFVKSVVELGSGVGLSGLKAFTSILQVMGTALSLIPEPVIKLLASFFVGLSAVKAPLMLAKYVVNIQMLARGAIEAGVSLGRSTKAMDQQAASAERTAAAVRDLATAEMQYSNAGKGILSGGVNLFGKGGAGGRMSRLGGKDVGGYAGIGLATAGALVSDGNGGGRDAVGSIAQFAGMGAMIGGPWGAVAGGAIGAITSIVSASRKAAADIKKHAMEAAAAWASEINEQVRAQYGDASNTHAISAFLAEATKGETIIKNYEMRITALKNAQRELGHSNDASVDQYVKLSVQIHDTKEQLEKYRLEQEALFKNSQYQDYLSSVAAKLALVAAANPDLTSGVGVLKPGKYFRGTISKDTTDLLGGQRTAQNTQDLELLNKELANLGITMDDLATKELPILQDMITLFTQLPDKVRDTLKATNEWNQKLKDAKALAETMWNPAQDKLGSQIAYNNSLTSALDAQAKAGSNLSIVNNRLAADQSLLTLKTQVFSMAIANGATQTQALTLAEQAYQRALKYRADAQQAALANYRLQGDAVIKQLLEAAGIADTLENRQIVINLTTKGVEDTLAKIGEVQQKLIDIQSDKSLPDFEKRDLIGQYQAKLAALKRELDEYKSGKNDPELAAQIAAAEEAANGEQRRKDAEEAAKRAAEEAKRRAEEAIRLAVEWQNKVENATSTVTNAVQSAANAIADAARSWVASIKERTQYEQAVSASRLTRNATRQIADVAELQAGINNLKSRGLTQAMLDSLGIDNVADTRQVRKLVNSSDSDLAALAATMSTLDNAATSLAQQQEDKRTRDNITAAIMDAAKQLDWGTGRTRDSAASISAMFNITPSSNPDELALQILSILTSGRISG